jgi:argininosuccinate lyase
MNKRLWGGAFSADSLPLLQEYSNSIAFDWQLAAHDIRGSIAHVTMLGECGIISTDESKQIRTGLEQLAKQVADGTIAFSIEDEDVHMNVERLLHEQIGSVAGKLHTARSRNDQVALDMHLYVREQCQNMISDIRAVQNVLLMLAEKHLEVVMPGYTHLQRAQPILFSHHLLAYFWMLERDKGRFSDCLKRANQSPLGAGALAGTTFAINRMRTAELLEFSSVYPNSLDAVSDRDFVIEFLSTSALTMTHLSRFCEEIVLWTSAEFRFLRLDDTYSTGSSIMPQKKNPDHAELIRGKSGRVYGALMSLLTTLKGLPLAYNKDMQEDKEGLFDTVKTLRGALQIMAGMLETVQVRASQMRTAAGADFSNATDMADYLAARGMPFREAHEVTAKLVAYCLENNTQLERLSIDFLKTRSALFSEDIFAALEVQTVVDRRISQGGTGTVAVKQQLESARALMSSN